MREVFQVWDWSRKQQLTVRQSVDLTLVVGLPKHTVDFDELYEQETKTTFVVIESFAAWMVCDAPKNKHFVPALCIRKQSDLSPVALDTLAAVNSPWLALVVRPGEAIDLSASLQHIDLVILQGSFGADSYCPILPEWARNIRDVCSSAGVAFMFPTWGRWVPLPEGQDGPNASCFSSLSKTQWFTKARSGHGFRLLDGREHMQLPEWL